MTAQEQLDRKDRALRSFPVFCSTYLQTEERKPLAMGKVHGVMQAEIEQARHEHKDICILAPMQSAKTTYFAIAYPTWELVRASCLQLGQLRYWVISADRPLAKRKLSEVRDILETNELLLEDFGELLARKKEVSATAFYLENLPYSRDPHFRATYPGGELGGRSDRMMLDDVFNEKNSATETPALKVKDAIKRTITSRKAVSNPEAQMIMVATDWGPLTAMREIEDKKPGWGNWKFVRIAALVDKQGVPLVTMPADRREAISYWPEVWTADHLLRLWADNEIGFLQMYQNSRDALSGDIFKNFFTFTRPTPSSFRRIQLGVDPVPTKEGETSEGDFMACTVAAHTETTTDILACLQTREDNRAQATLIKDLWKQFVGFRVVEENGEVEEVPLPAVIKIEDVGAQVSALTPYLEGYPVEAQTTGGKAKVARILAMASYVNSGRLRFWDEGPGVPELVMDLRRCRANRGKKMGLAHIDRIDSMEIASRSFLGGGEWGVPMDLSEVLPDRMSGDGGQPKPRFLPSNRERFPNR